ncbi:gluconate transport-inducing protein [Moesziomyces antarcticus T-34]|uniref:Gluconate transport-inducing protein n=1 Tax=Pseudozyma antarctica (strain T-34) TaxID=1151754 RepID=M9MAK6_PSEA3|nr:gluconate transport-inducing protein [Moesziomyces antarcticus T-34]
MDFHPKNIVITCIFLASKAENYAVLGELARKLAVKSNDRAVTQENRRTVLDLELLVSQSLQFEYAVTGAHRALYGLLLDLQSLPDNQAPATPTPPSPFGHYLFHGIFGTHVLRALKHRNVDPNR